MLIRINGEARVETDAHADDATNALRYVTAALPSEPLFVIRGRDALAFPALMEYAELCRLHGLDTMTTQVEQHAERFRQWQADCARSTRLPDPWPGWPVHGIPGTMKVINPDE